MEESNEISTNQNLDGSETMNSTNISLLSHLDSITPLQIAGDNDIRVTNYSQRTQSVGGKKKLLQHPGASLVIPQTATIAGGSILKMFRDDIQSMFQIKNDLKDQKDQKGLLNCSGLFCPNVYLSQIKNCPLKIPYLQNKGFFGTNNCTELYTYKN